MIETRQTKRYFKRKAIKMLAQANKIAKKVSISYIGGEFEKKKPPRLVIHIVMLNKETMRLV